MDNEYDCETDCETDEEIIPIVINNCNEVIISDIVEAENKLVLDLNKEKKGESYYSKLADNFMNVMFGKDLDAYLTTYLERYINNPLDVYIIKNGMTLLKFGDDYSAYRDYVLYLYEKVYENTDISKHPYFNKYGYTLNNIRFLLQVKNINLFLQKEEDGTSYFVLKNAVMGNIKRCFRKDTEECYHILVNSFKQKTKNITRIFEYDRIWEHISEYKVKREFIHDIQRLKRTNKTYIPDDLISNSIDVKKRDNKFYVTLNINNVSQPAIESNNSIVDSHFELLKKDLTLLLTRYLKHPFAGIRYSSRIVCPLVTEYSIPNRKTLEALYGPKITELYKTIVSSSKNHISNHSYIENKGMKYENLLHLVDVSNLEIYIRLDDKRALYMGFNNQLFYKLMTSMKQVIGPHRKIYEDYILRDIKGVNNTITLKYTDAWEYMSRQVILEEYIYYLKKNINVCESDEFIKEHTTIIRQRDCFSINLQL